MPAIPLMMSLPPVSSRRNDATILPRRKTKIRATGSSTGRQVFEIGTIGTPRSLSHLMTFSTPAVFCTPSAASGSFMMTHLDTKADARAMASHRRWPPDILRIGVVDIGGLDRSYLWRRHGGFAHRLAVQPEKRPPPELENLAPDTQTLGHVSIVGQREGLKHRPGDLAQKGRFAGAVVTQPDDRLARGEGEIGVVHGVAAAVDLGQAPCLKNGGFRNEFGHVLVSASVNFAATDPA